MNYRFIGIIILLGKILYRRTCPQVKHDGSSTLGDHIRQVPGGRGNNSFRFSENCLPFLHLEIRNPHHLYQPMEKYLPLPRVLTNSRQNCIYSILARGTGQKQVKSRRVHIEANLLSRLYTLS